MTFHHDDYSSDSDNDDLSGVETSVLLGIPDGVVDNPTDIIDAAVSRIGGHPAFLPSREPSLSASQCKICSNPSELLVQMWCPFQDSPMDRALYVWGCARAPCQGKQGSIRAWRGLRRNDKYAAKLERKLAKMRATEKVIPSEHRNMTAQKNPFVATPSISHTFGLAAHIFGDSPSLSLPDASPPIEDKYQDSEDDLQEESASASPSENGDDDLVTAMATLMVTDSPWKAAPSYPPLYLSTASEYLPPLPRSKLPPGVQVADPLDKDSKSNKYKDKDKDISWASEAYEDSLEVDHVFERFTKRVGYEGEQCVRYELGGTPLPFSSDSVFISLFPTPPAPALPVTKAVFTVAPTPKRVYSPTGIPACPVCRSKRVFECQLMPNLINVLRQPEAKTQQTDEDRRKTLERTLASSSAPRDGDTHDMEWGTCMIFSCEKDCYIDDHGKDVRECWREEVVLIQAAI